jgi:hypothetical protein
MIFIIALTSTYGMALPQSNTGLRSNEIQKIQQESELKGIREGAIMGEKAAIRNMNNKGSMGYHTNNNGYHMGYYSNDNGMGPLGGWGGTGGGGYDTSNFAATKSRRYRNSAFSLNNYVWVTFVVAATVLAFSL